MPYERLEFLTLNFSVLQGLRIVPLGALLVGWKLIEPVWVKSNLRDTAQLVLAAAAVAAFFLIGRYYENRFGRVRSRRNAAWAALFLLALLASAGLDDFTNPPISWSALLLAFFFAGGVAASQGRRWHLLVPTAAFIFLSVLPAAGAVSAAAVNDRLAPITFGCALVFTGVLDHFLLIRTLREAPDA